MASFDGKLERLKPSVPAVAGPDCPQGTVWREIVAAVTPSDQALSHLQHASRCDHCGPLLREAVAAMNENITDSEAKQIASLESARPEWQRTLAARIAGTPVTPTAAPWWRVWARVPRLALAAAGLAVIFAGSWFAVRETRPIAPADLLANAYSEQRTFELRIAGARYGPVRVQRGGDASFMSRPEALLKAESRIAAEIGSHPSDPNWLQAKARADLLEGKYDSAVDTLRHALQIAPKTPGLLIDLATAYFQRSQAANRPEDLGAAYESLSQALAAEPDNTVALFNRAIVAEHQFLFHQALDDWDHYLRVDPGSDWAIEARQRADAVRAKLKEHDQSHAAPLLTPAQIAVQLGNVDVRASIPNSATVGTPELRAQVDQRVEAYLHEAVRSWLPQAYPEGRAAPDPSAAEALFFLAILTAQQHGDRWLSDLVSASSSPNFPKAATALAAAMKASDDGDYDAAVRQADMAARSFKAANSPAGLLYAEFEQAFAAQVLRRSDQCQQEASAALSQTEMHPYWWLQVQLGLEVSVCSGITNNLGTFEKEAERAMQRAHRAGYGALAVRALGFIAGSKSDMGDGSEASTLLNSGLAAYWSGQFPVARGYNLYGIAADAVESAGRPNLQLALLSESLILMTSDANLLQRARIESEAARVATVAQKASIAKRHYAEAARLYAQAPQNDAIRAYALYNRILAAQAVSSPEQFEQAAAQLAAIKNEVRQLADDLVTEMYYSAIGRVELARQHYAEAEQALRQALVFAEKDLASLQSEEERIKWSKDVAPIYLGFAEAKLAQGQSQESLDVFEWYLGAAQRARRGARGSQPGLPESARVSSRIPLLSRETVVAYGFLPRGVAIWSYDNRGLQAQWLPGKNGEVLDIVGRLNDLASDPGSDLQAFRRQANSLYELLISPIEPHLEAGRTIVIETDELLSRVPFESLLDSNGHYLLERTPIVHSLGVYADEQLRPALPISADSPTLVAASTAGAPGNGLVPLPDIGTEGEAVAGYFHDVRVLRSQQVTLSQIRTGFRTATVFHFAGHALANSQQIGLVLDDRDPETQRPRLLDAEALRLLKPQRLELAVLSACDTANGTGDDRSGLSNLSEAFLRSGVPHVVASRWAVDSAQTRIFVGDFYHNLVSGSPVSDAVRIASLKMLANPQTAHPYYWSAFAAYGRP